MQEKLTKIISKSIVGGWKQETMESHRNLCSCGGTLSCVVSDLMVYYAESFYSVFCDPHFWQALGKACNWNRYNHLAPEMLLDGWKENALRFHELNLTESLEKAIDYLLTVIGE